VIWVWILGAMALLIFFGFLWAIFSHSSPSESERRIEDQAQMDYLKRAKR
jgi:hypothetical protein